MSKPIHLTLVYNPRTFEWEGADAPAAVLDGLGELCDNLRLDFPHLRGTLTLVLDTVADPESGLDAPPEDPFAELDCAVAH